MTVDALTLAVDLDGVIYDFDTAWTARHHRQFDSGVHALMPQRWNELHLLAGMESPDAFWDWWYATGGFTDLPLHEGAKQALDLADWRGWSIFYVTNRPLDRETAQALLLDRLPQPHHLIHTATKWAVPAHLFVEDSPHNLAQLMQTPQNPRPWVLRVSRPWNQELAVPAHADLENLTPEAIGPWLERVERGEAPNPHT